MKAGAAPRTVLMLTRNFPPLVGGMERLVLRMAEALATRTRLAIVGPAGASRFAPPHATVYEVPAAPLWRFGLAMLRRALAAACAPASRPGLVIGGSGLVAPFVRVAAALAGARSAVYLHGLDLVAPSLAYRLLWLPMIRGCDVALCNSEHTRGLALARGLSPERVHVLHPGVDLPQGVELADAGRSWRATHGLEGRAVALSVGRLTRRKGLVEFIRNVLPRLVAERPDVVLAVIGAEAADALAAGPGGELARIQAAIDAVGLHAHVCLLGPCGDAELLGAYAGADVHVFPVLDLPGDVEGFGMVALEAAAHGLPSVAHAVGGVPDAVREGVSGYLLAPGDAAGFAAAVHRVLAPGARASLAAGCLAFAADKAWPAFGRRLVALLELPDA